jgi:hypothetical protein
MLSFPVSGYLIISHLVVDFGLYHAFNISPNDNTRGVNSHLPLPSSEVTNTLVIKKLRTVLTSISDFITAELAGESDSLGKSRTKVTTVSLLLQKKVWKLRTVLSSELQKKKYL